eukprot:12149207-Karenia_brevis.AAC.1
MALQLAKSWFRFCLGLVCRALPADCLEGALVLGARHLVQRDDVVILAHLAPQKHVQHGVGKRA